MYHLLTGVTDLGVYGGCPTMLLLEVPSHLPWQSHVGSTRVTIWTTRPFPGLRSWGMAQWSRKGLRQCLPINVVNHDKPNRPLLGMVSYWVCHIRLPNLQLRIFYSEQLDQLLVVLEPLDRFFLDI